MPASPRRTSAPLSPRRTALSNSSSLAHSLARPRSIGPEPPRTRTSSATPGLPARWASRAPLAFPALALSGSASLRIWTLLTAGPISCRRANSSPEWENRNLLQNGARGSATTHRFAGAGFGDRGRIRRLRRVPETGRGVSASDRRSRAQVQKQQSRTLGAPSGGRRRPAPRFAALRHHAGYTLLGLRLVLGPQSDAGARRRTDTAGGTLGSRRPRARTNQESPQRTPPDARCRAHHRRAQPCDRPDTGAAGAPASDRTHAAQHAGATDTRGSSHGDHRRHDRRSHRRAGLPTGARRL